MITYLQTSEQFDTPKGAVSNGYYVINVTKSEISSTSAYAAIQSALDEAQENATTDLPYKVFVDPGKYSLTQGLRIYSNTYLCLTGVTLTQNKGSNYNMIKVGDSNDTHSGYYYQNITIDGGIWNENGNSNTAIKDLSYTEHYSDECHIEKLFQFSPYGDCWQ